MEWEEWSIPWRMTCYLNGEIITRVFPSNPVPHLRRTPSVWGREMGMGGRITIDTIYHLSLPGALFCNLGELSPGPERITPCREERKNRWR